ncbi:MAG: tetratricopeptide repeat protein [bacterium]|nr:tetratricopeptide repeat protein [bacterium]
MATDVEQLEALQQAASDEQDEAKAEQMLRKALALTNHHIENVHRDRSWWRTERVRASYKLAVLLDRRDANEDALEMLRSVYTDAVNGDDRVLRMMVQHEFGRILLIRGVLDVALDILVQAHALATDLHDTRVLGTTTGNIGMVYFNTRRFDEALTWFEHAVHLMRDAGDVQRQALAIRAIGMTYSKLKRYKEALAQYDSARALLSTVHDYEPRALVQIEESIGVDHLNLADQTHKQTHYQKAIKQFELCRSIAREHDLAVMEAVALRNTAEVYAEQWFKECSIEQSEALFREALVIVQRCGIKLLESQIRRELASTLEKQGRVTEALAEFRAFYALDQEVVSEGAAQKLRMMEVRFAVEATQRESQEQRARAEALAEDLVKQSAHLTATSLAIGEKNAELRVVRATLNTLSKEAPDSIAAELRKAVLKIDRLTEGDDRWSGIEEQLTRVHGDALQRLATKHKNLTPTERKVCALIRIDLSSKDIARVLSAEPRSIEKYRQRIRKKLGLAADDSLSAYIASV